MWDLTEVYFNVIPISIPGGVTIIIDLTVGHFGYLLGQFAK